jgi:hypothetical protein
MEIEALKKIDKQNLPSSINLKLDMLINELETDASYAADEIIVLGEEILSQLAAFGFAVYLNQKEQKDFFNDKLIDLFSTSSGHTNAGVYYFLAKNMLEDVKGDDVKKLNPFLNNINIEHLSKLRNEVMHGFFVLPPERNKKEALNIANVLEEMSAKNLFDCQWGGFHFLTDNSFNGNWQLTNNNWSQFSKCYSFSKRAARIEREFSNDFANEEAIFIDSKKEELTNLNREILFYLSSKNEGAIGVWHLPDHQDGIAAYRSIVQALNKSSEYLPVFYSAHEDGTSYSKEFLIDKLGKQLFDDTKDEKYLKNTFLKKLGNQIFAEKNIVKDSKVIKKDEPLVKSKKRPIAIISNIHIALFNQNHLLSLVNDLHRAQILLIAIGEHYHYLDRFFNKTIPLPKITHIPSEVEWKKSLRNYLRFKGPSDEIKSEVPEVEKLRGIIATMCKELTDKKTIVARHFADTHEQPIEFVHEAMAVLNPYFNHSKDEKIINFEEDKTDELYEFPIEIKESSQIFLSMGRRDIKLEYKHKTLSL